MGGGPTSIEFTSELFDFLTRDVVRWYPDLDTRYPPDHPAFYQLYLSSHSVTLIEAGKHLLGSFDESLSGYVERLFKVSQHFCHFCISVMAKFILSRRGRSSC